MTSKSRIIANSGRYVEADGSPKFGSNVTLTTIGGQVSAVVSRDSGEAAVANYSSIDSLPISNLITGTVAFVENINAIYVTDGSGWFSIATVNQTPVIYDGVGDTLELSTEGVATVVTITAVDSEGVPLVFSAVPDSDFAGLATISQDSSVFTITPLSEDSATTTSATVTFRASDGVNVAGGVNTFTLLFRSEYWKDAVLSIGTNSTNGIQNSTFIDRSTNARTVTPSGTSLQTTFHPYLENWSVEFNGSDALQISASIANDFGTSTDFTIEYWVKFLVNTSSSNQYVYDFSNNGSRTQLYQNVLYLYFTSSEYVTAAYAEVGEWVHIALCRSGSTGYGFVNGQLAGTIALSGTAGSSSAWRIGQWGGGAYGLNGHISNFRTIKGTALYTSNFTPPTEKLTAISGTSLLTCQSNRFIDNSNNSHTISLTGTPEISAFNPFGPQSEYAVGGNRGSVLFPVNNSNSYLNIPGYTEASVDFWGDTDATFEAWIYPTSFSSVAGAGAWPSLIANHNSWAFGTTNTGALRFYYEAVDATYYFTYAGPVLKLNEWSHISFVHKVGSGIKLFLNGVGESYNTVTFPERNTRVNVTIGTYTPSRSDNWFKGYISDLRMVLGSELYTSNFTPPSVPISNTNATLYLPFDNAGIFDKTGNHTLTPVGNASTSTTQTKYADTAMYFDGTGDYILIEKTPSIDIQTGNFTIECWAYPLSKTNSVDSVFGYGNFKIMLYHNNTNWSLEIGNGSSVTFTLTGSATLNSWQHLALVRSGNTFTFYINGISVSTNTTTTIGTLEDLTIGLNDTGNSQWFTGYMENFQILRGVAKYTSNFTPPVQTQGLIYQATGFPLNTEGTAVTDLSAFEATSPQAGWYYIQPTGAASAALVEYSGTDFKSSGKGYFRWWRSVDTLAPTINHYGLSWQFDEMLIDLEGVEYQDVIFSANQTYNQRNSTGVADGGSRAGYRVFFGYAGGHGIYNTSQTPCAWGVSTGSIGAGFDGSCGTFPNNLRMGTGTGGNTYANRGNTISFWFRW